MGMINKILILSLLISFSVFTQVKRVVRADTVGTSLPYFMMKSTSSHSNISWDAISKDSFQDSLLTEINLAGKMVINADSVGIRGDLNVNGNILNTGKYYGKTTTNNVRIKIDDANRKITLGAEDILIEGVNGGNLHIAGDGANDETHLTLSMEDLNTGFYAPFDGGLAFRVNDTDVFTGAPAEIIVHVPMQISSLRDGDRAQYIFQFGSFQNVNAYTEIGDIDGVGNSTRIKIDDGNKTITLTVDSISRFVMSSTQFILADSGAGTALKIDGTAGINLVIALGDLDGNGNSTVVTVDDIGNLITLFSDTLSVVAEKIKFPNIPSDSTVALTGELWYNSTTGAIHRKF